MDLLTLLFRLPFLPLRGFIRLGEIIQDEAERQLHDPSAVRRQLEEAEQARMSGEISDEEIAQAEGEATARVLATHREPSAGTSESREGS
jgi:cytochrome c-type biogenesis protein CcmH/NrfG